MILPFSTQLNGKPTYFVEKIHSALLQNNLLQGYDLGFGHGFDLDKLCSCEPKLHTIREDIKDRWQPGTKIDFFINCRQKDMFRFAPVLPVVSTQKIQIKRHLDYVSIFIDKVLFEIELDEFTKKIKSTDPVIKQLAQNDGFDTIEDFLTYFNKDFKGKIIHWTNLKY